MTADIYMNIPPDMAYPNPRNPRKTFDEESMAELVESVRQHGVLQPLVVLEDEEKVPQMFRIVCGERRWRAAIVAGLKLIPVVIKKLTPEQELEYMIIENLQRKDVDPIEEANGFKTLLDAGGYTQEELAKKVGCSQSQVANRLRLLELPEIVQKNISHGIISPSHGKILAGHKNLPAPVIEKAAEIIANDNIPVARAASLVPRIVGENGMPLYDHWNSSKKPLFKSGKGSACYECEYRAMGTDAYVTGDQPYCLNRQCWEIKQQEALQKQLEKAEKAMEGKDVVNLDSLNYNQYEYWSEGATHYDQSECMDCEKRKLGKRQSQKLSDASYYCFDPACKRKKEAAKTRADNKTKKDALQAELGQITEMLTALGHARSYGTYRDMADENPGYAIIDRIALIYIAAQILANVDPWQDRKITRYQYLKNKFGWESDVVKNGAYNLLQYDWDSFRRLLEGLDDMELLDVIFEWPAVARGLKGAEGWFLRQVPQPEPQPQVAPEPKEESEGKLPPGISDRVGWILKNSAGDINYITNIPNLTDAELLYCILNENRKSGLQKLKAEARKRGLQVTEEQRSTEIPARRYLDKNGRIIFVDHGLWSKSGETEYGTFWQSASGGHHRVKTQAMPMVASREEAQRNLDAWAKKNGLQPIDSKDENGAA